MNTKLLNVFSIFYFGQPFSAIFLEWDRELEKYIDYIFKLALWRHAEGVFFLFSTTRPFNRE